MNVQTQGPACRARAAVSPADLDACLALRSDVFRGGASDADDFDDAADHVLIERMQDRAVICCFRYQIHRSALDISRSYAAQFYDLTRVQAAPYPKLELGRFCIAPDLRDSDVLRVAWASLAEVVVQNGIELLFGCSSFPGVDADRYHHAFAWLRDNAVAPAHLSPGKSAPEAIAFGALGQYDTKSALRAMPPLLKTYLAMGGWVSDHAVVDHDLGTLHVFTGVEIASIPPARRRSILAATTRE